VKSLETKRQKFTIKQTAGSVLVKAEDMIPEWYRKTKTEKVLDKKQIKEDLSA
jgi:hypothetical protein